MACYKTYRETIDEFEDYILPEIVKASAYGADDETAINEGWNDWTDGLRTDGEISDRAYGDWCYEPDERDTEEDGFVIMFDGDDEDELIQLDSVDADNEEEAEYLVEEYSEYPEYSDGRVFYELA